MSSEYAVFLCLCDMFEDASLSSIIIYFIYLLQPEFVISKRLACITDFFETNVEADFNSKFATSAALILFN